MTRCTCGFEDNWGVVWAHVMNAKDAHAHKIEKEFGRHVKPFGLDELIICDKCGSVLGVKDEYSK